MRISQLSRAKYIYGVKLPANALWAYQPAKYPYPARYLWVEDIRTCGYSQFRIRAMDCSTDRIYSYLGDVKRDSVAAAFAKFADNLPLEKICPPVWDTPEEMRACGPKDRRPQRFDAKGKKPDNVKLINDRSVVDGCKIGGRRYSAEGYYSYILGCN